MTLKELSHDSFYNMQNYNQITIDFIEETEEIIQGLDGKTSVIEELGALSYRIDVVLEVISPELTHDADAMRDLLKIIKERMDNEI